MKKYKLSANEIKPLATGLGGCVCTDRVTVDGHPVMYMYRDEPINENDSGWRFFAGDEDEEYMGNNANHSVYDVNTIANYDPLIIPHLGLPYGSELAREDEDEDFELL